MLDTPKLFLFVSLFRKYILQTMFDDCVHHFIVLFGIHRPKPTGVKFGNSGLVFGMSMEIIYENSQKKRNTIILYGIWSVVDEIEHIHSFYNENRI